VAGVCEPSVARAGADPVARTVVVLLFDGVSLSFLANLSTPTFDVLRREGAWTHHMEPAFPTISLPNQVTISTGCWPERHGIVSNAFFDRRRGRYDHSHDADWLTGCEHLHVAAERQGIPSAALGWVGSHSGLHGPLANDVGEKDLPRGRGKASVEADAARADAVIRLLARPPDARPRLILTYFHGPDWAAHFRGMDAPATKEAIAGMDTAVARVLAALRSIDGATLIVTTDHGMVPVTTIVNVRKILVNHAIRARVASAGTTSFLYFDDVAERDRAADLLRGYDAFSVVRRDAQPANWHLGAGPRVGDLILSARPPYFMEDVGHWPWWARWLEDWGPELLWAEAVLKASHGYPPETPGVEGVLYAWGAGIAVGREVPAVRAIDVHPTVTHLLGIESGAPVDGIVARALLAE